MGPQLAQGGRVREGGAAAVAACRGGGVPAARGRPPPPTAATLHPANWACRMQTLEWQCSAPHGLSSDGRGAAGACEGTAGNRGDAGQHAQSSMQAKDLE